MTGDRVWWMPEPAPTYTPPISRELAEMDARDEQRAWEAGQR